MQCCFQWSSVHRPTCRDKQSCRCPFLSSRDVRPMMKTGIRLFPSINAVAGRSVTAGGSGERENSGGAPLLENSEFPTALPVATADTDGGG